MMKSFEESVKGILSGYEAEVPAGLFEKISESLDHPAQSPQPKPVNKAIDPYTPAISGIVVATAGLMVAGMIAGDEEHASMQEPAQPAGEMITEAPGQEKDAETYYLEEENTEGSSEQETTSEVQSGSSDPGEESVGSESGSEDTAQAADPNVEGAASDEETSEEIVSKTGSGEEPKTPENEATAETQIESEESPSGQSTETNISEIASIQARPLRGGVPLEVNLSAPGGAREYEWTIDERLVRNGRNVRHTFEETGRHRVKLKVTGDDGRSSEDEEVIEAVEGSTLFIPNSFTPNGDNVNDVYRAEGARIGSFLMEIYNIKGEKVFTSNDPSSGWDGEDKISEQQNRDSYIVVIKARGTDGRDLSTQKMINVFR